MYTVSDFGDTMGYSLWKAETMDWKSFNDISDEMKTVDAADYGSWDEFGEYQHYMNTIDFDWDSDNLWESYDEEKNTKCSAILPGLFAKVCLHYAPYQKNAKVQFAAATADELNNILNADYDTYDNGQETYNMPRYSAEQIDDVANMLKEQFNDLTLEWNNDEDWNEIKTVYNHAQKYYDEQNKMNDDKNRRRMPEGLQPDIKPFHKGNSYGVTLDIGKGHRKAMEVGIPLPVVDKCRNMFIASICVNGNMNTMRFGLKVNIATGKSLLRRAMRLSKLLSKYKGKFATVLGSFFSELKKTTASGESESKTQQDAYHFAKQAVSENFLYSNYYYDDEEYDDQDEGFFDYDADEYDSDYDAIEQMEYDAMSAEFYAEFGLMSFEEFNTDENWDTKDVLQTNDNAKVVKKCRKTLGLNWCYCKSEKIGIPFACFGNANNDKNTLATQISQAKQLIDATDNMMDEEYYYDDDDYYYDDYDDNTENEEDEYYYDDEDDDDEYYNDYDELADQYYDALLQNYYQNVLNYQNQLLAQNYYQNLYNDVYSKVQQQQLKAAEMGEQRRRTMEYGDRRYGDNSYRQRRYRRDGQRARQREALLEEEREIAAAAEQEIQLGDYGYYEDLNLDDVDDAEEEEEEEMDENVQDQWIDNEDGMSWSISTQEVTDYDTKWDQDEIWDEIAPSITTIHGNLVTRKCLHMWGKRLCLCQFLNWMDSRRYKCLPTAYIAPSTPVSYNDGGGPYYNDVETWHHKLSHKPAITGIDTHVKYKERHTNKPGKLAHEVHMKHTTRVHRKGVKDPPEYEQAKANDAGDFYDYGQYDYTQYDDEYEQSAFMIYKRFVDHMNHLFYSNDDNWDEIKFTNNDDIQKCNNKLHKKIQVCFCEDQDKKQPYECNQDGEGESSAKLFPFMNTLRMNQGINEQQLTGMGNIGDQGSNMNAGSLERLSNIDPSELKDMQDYSFTMQHGYSNGGNPVTVNVHFKYPENYKDKVENGAFGAQELAEDNLLEDDFAEIDDEGDFAMGEDGVYNDFEYIDDNHYDDYFSDFDDDQEDDDDDEEYDYNYNEQEVDDYDYYSEQYGDDESDEEEYESEDIQREHVFEYEADDDDEEFGNNALKDIEGNAAYIDMGYDEKSIDSDMRISIEKGENRYVPYMNPDITGFNQKVRISWNTFWKLQTFAIFCGIMLFVSISIYFNNPFKDLKWPALYLATQQATNYNNVKVFENNDDNIVDYDYNNDQDENEQLKE